MLKSGLLLCCIQKRVSLPVKLLAIVNAATEQAVGETGVEARIILCTLRFFSTEQSLETVHLVEEFHNTYIAGFDIAAESPGNVIDNHIPAFMYARENDIPFTAHVGETRGVENFWDTIKSFSPSRVGHGVCSIEDPALLEYVRQHKIHLEACPTSNVQTNCYDTYADHPVDKLHQAGVSIGVNTDDRTIANISLSEEYEKLHLTFGWEVEDFYACNKHALEAAFVSDEVRDKLLAQLAEGYQQYL